MKGMGDKVTVIGAGTAGLITAKNLSALGIDTTVYDQKPVLGYPAVASGIISIKGLRSLGVDYSKAITNTLYGANIHAGNTVMHIRSLEPKAHVLDRQLLNEACFDESVKSGAKVVKSRKVEDADLEAFHRDSVIVGADGPLSLVARHFRMGTIEKYALTYKAEYNIESADPNVVDLFFDNRTAPKFFGWLCPNSKDVLEVGIGIDSRHGNSKAAFDRFVEKKVHDAVAGAKMLSGHASIIPLQSARKMVDPEKEVLLVGDAAGQVKPTTGGGIVFGGRAAIIAAKAIADHMKNGKSLMEYEKTFRKRYGLDLKLHGLIRAFYSGLDESGMGFAIKLLNTLGAEAFFSRYGDMDSPATVVKKFFVRGLAK